MLWLEDSYFLVKFDQIEIAFKELIWIPFYWIGLFVPQVYFGSYLGFTGKASSFPCSVSLVPRSTENVPWYMQNEILAIVGGCFPFMYVAVVTKGVLLYSLLLILWNMDQRCLLNDLSAPSLLLNRFVLDHKCTCRHNCSAGLLSLVGSPSFPSEKHQWWWASFHAAGGTGLWTYFIHLYASLLNKLSSSSTSTWTEFAIFNGINLFFSVFLYLASGATATLAAQVFTRHVYRRMKLD